MIKNIMAVNQNLADIKLKDVQGDNFACLRGNPSLQKDFSASNKKPCTSTTPYNFSTQCSTDEFSYILSFYNFLLLPDYCAGDTIIFDWQGADGILETQWQCTINLSQIIDCKKKG
jgi:hypothetical protein